MIKPILILKTGELSRRMIAQFGRSEQAFLDLLGEEQCAVVDARKETLPEVGWARNIAGIVVTGSVASANDTDPWIAKSEDFLKRAADQSVPIYGICFGHQHVARTFGGRVEKNPRGWELGTATVSLTQEGQRNVLFASVPESFLAQESHGEIVTELPPGARALVHNDNCAYQAFSLDDRIWGTQFHPEYTPALMQVLIALHTAALPLESFPRWPSDEGPLQDWLRKTVRSTPAAQRCLNNFASIVMERLRAQVG